LEAINIDVNYYLIKPATLKKVKDMLDKISIDLLRSSEKIIRFDENIYFNQTSKKLYNKNIMLNITYTRTNIFGILMAI
jgi:YesN/AraC family two-component response regulator